MSSTPEDWTPLSGDEFADHFRSQSQESASGVHDVKDAHHGANGKANGHTHEPPEGFYEQDLPEENTTDRSPPHDLTAEACVLCCVLGAGELHVVREVISPKHFFSEAHRRIFEATIDLDVRGLVPDMVLVQAELSRSGRLAQVGGSAYLSEILNAPVSNKKQLLSYAQIVFDHWRAREQITVAQTLAAYGYSGRDVGHLVDSLRELKELQCLPSNEQLTSDSIFEDWKTSGPLVHEPLQLGPLDELTGGGPVYGSRWYVVGAPDACKTALLAQIADTLATRGIAVGMLAVDEEADDVQSRLVQGFGFARRECEIRDPSRVTAMQNTLAQRYSIPIQLFEPTETVESAAKKLAAIAETAQTRAVLLMDSVQSIECEAVQQAREEPSEHVRVTQNVRAIRAVSTKHKLITITTSEMNRDAYKNGGNGNGKMAAAKQSGAIEYSARVMLILEPVKDHHDLIQVSIEKNKHGPRGSFFFLQLDRARMRLSHAPPPDDEPKPSRQEQRETERDDLKARREAKEAEEKARKERVRREELEGIERRRLEAVARVVRERPGILLGDLRTAVRVACGHLSDEKIAVLVEQLKRSGRIRVEKGPKNSSLHYPVDSAEQDGQ